MALLLRNARLATMVPDAGAYGAIDGDAILIASGRIEAVGSAGTLLSANSDVQEIDVEGRWITPGLIDCHTHIVHAGDRAREFALRLEGAGYEEIARAGGGILSTMAATRAASAQELLRQSLSRLDALIAEGVTTIEIKSGYGLEVESECRMLRVARMLEKERPVRVRTSFLGAHAIPSGFRERSEDYIAEVVGEMLPAAHAQGLVDAVDGFCETIAFTPGQIAHVFETARQLDLPVKLHAEQLSDQKGALMAASRFGALSCDHLEHLDEDGVQAMAQAGAVAVLLPGAFYTLRQTKMPPVDLLRRHGVPMAVATDCNPGSSPVTSILLMLNMACTLFRLTPEEALAGVTRHAARALDLANEVGTIESGKRADLCIWDIGDPAELAYRIGFNPLHRRITDGIMS